MSENHSKTVITPVIDEGEEAEDNVGGYSPVDYWNKSSDDVLILSSEDEDCGSEKLRHSNIVVLDSDPEILRKKRNRSIVDLDVDITCTPNTSSRSPKRVNQATSLEDCEILTNKSNNVQAKTTCVNELFTISNDPQSSKTISVKINEVSQPCKSSAPLKTNDSIQSSGDSEKNESDKTVLQIDEIIDKGDAIDVDDGVITIDSDNEPEICSTPPRTTLKRKISIGSSPVAVSSKHITTAVVSQHTDATFSFYLLSDIDLISDKLGIDKKMVEKVVKMLVDECTVPFISRYRQFDLQGLNCDKIREISEAFKELKRAQKRVEEIEKLLQKRNSFSPMLKSSLSKCTTITEVERHYIPYANEDDEAVRAKHLGLDKSAQMIVDGIHIEAQDCVRIGCNGLESVDAIVAGWKAIVTDMICKDTEVMTRLSDLYKEHVPVIETELDDDKIAELYNDNKEYIVRKYLKYKEWKMPVNAVKTQAVFQINRGEREGVLRVYVNFSEEIEKDLRQFCMNKWKKCSPTILSNCIYIAWDNFMKPNFAQHIRWQLTNDAHKVALNVFQENVKYLLLEEPIRGKTVLGIDPGYGNGCKLAVVSPWGVPIATLVVYVTDDEAKLNTCAELKRLVSSFECNTIALGNGTGCREVEQLLIYLIKAGHFLPSEVSYKIISESGVSCYSVSSEATNEFPDLAPNLISAVSIARRLQDPLSELVKADPKKLEVGMYMRDIDSEKVNEVFNEVVIECVSFVGVDVNIASSVLLCKVSGITPEIAENIVKTRVQNGPFKSREQLRVVEGVSSKNFEQFAGFVRIIPETSQVDIEEFNFLDATIIHPESYDDALKLLKYMGVEANCIGSPYICEVIDRIVSRFDYRDLAVFCTASISLITFLLDAFKKPLNFDVRLENQRTFYKSNITHFDDIKTNMNLRGRVVNVTPIGAFIDVGLGGRHHAYLPPSDSDALHCLVPRQIVLVQVIRVERNSGKLKVRLKKIIE